MHFSCVHDVWILRVCCRVWLCAQINKIIQLPLSIYLCNCHLAWLKYCIFLECVRQSATVCTGEQNHPTFLNHLFGWWPLGHKWSNLSYLWFVGTNDFYFWKSYFWFVAEGTIEFGMLNKSPSSSVSNGSDNSMTSQSAEAKTVTANGSQSVGMLTTPMTVVPVGPLW